MSRRDELAAQVAAALRGYQRATDALDELAGQAMELNRTDQRVVDLLEDRGAMTAGELAAGAGITSGAVTGVIDRLERAGYARRVPDPRDRRRVVVEPSAAVRKQADAVYGGMAEKGARVMRGYTVAELETVIRFVRDATAITLKHAEELRARR